MISTRHFKPEKAGNDMYKTYRIGESQEKEVQDISYRKVPGMISTRLIKPKRAKKDKHKIYPT